MPPARRPILTNIRRPLAKSAPAPRPRGVPAAKKIFLVGIFIIAQILFFNSDFFRLRSLEITGNERLSHEEIMKAAQVPWGANVCFLEEQGCDDSLAKMLWIKKVRFVKTYPGGLRIEVKERNPVINVASTDEPEKWFYADDEGVVLCPSENDRGPELPRLLIPGKVTEGARIDGDRVDAAMKFSTWVNPELSKKIKYFMIEANYQISYFYDLGGKVIEVKLGKLEEVDKKMDVFNKILKEMEGKSRQLEYVDLRYNEPVVKINEGRSPEKPEKKEGE